MQVLFPNTDLLFIAPIFIHFLAHISENCCATTITAASHPPPQAETSVLLYPEAISPKICSYCSSLMHSCPSFCTKEYFRTLSSLHVTISEDAEGGMVENLWNHVTHREKISLTFEIVLMLQMQVPLLSSFTSLISTPFYCSLKVRIDQRAVRCIADLRQNCWDWESCDVNCEGN